MNHYVPDFDMEDDHNFNSNSSTITRHKVDDEIMELLWQDGQVIAQPQNHRKPPTTLPPSPSQQHLYMAEDEMATWLHYPLEDLYSELLCENQTSQLPPISTVRHPAPPPPTTVAQLTTTPTTTARNFGLFSRMRGNNNDLERSSSLRPGLTVVESNSTPGLATMKSVGEVSSAFPSGGGGGGRLEKGGGSGEMTVLSSSETSGSGGGATVGTGGPSVSEDAGVKGEVEDRKKKRKEVEESTTQTTATGQDLEHEADNDEKKHSQEHFTAKRSRAAEVHNLSERRRRDRINERMKALQELIPRCNKSDKASMLDEAIEYLKSLQMQVQMMSMGCTLVPMMYPGMQQYLPPMGMGMRMARPMIPFPPNMPGSNSATAHGAAAEPQFGPRFGIPPACMPSVSSSNLSGNQAGNSIRGSYPVQSPGGLAQVPNMGDPYQQYLYLQQMQMQIQMQMQQMQAIQNQAISQPGSSKPSTSKSEGQVGTNTSKSEGEEDH